MVYVALQVLLCQAFVAEAEAVIVCVNKTNMQKTLIPELVRQKLKEFELTVGHQI